MTVVIISTWDDLPQVLMIKTVMSEVTRLYDQPQVLMIKTVMST
jgi:hypothetical protein